MLVDALNDRRFKEWTCHRVFRYCKSVHPITTTEQTIATPGQPPAIIPVDESQSSTSVETKEMVVDDLRNQISHVKKLREIIQDCRSGVNRQMVKIITKPLNVHPKPSYYAELPKLESHVISLCSKITQAGLDQEHYLNELESLLKELFLRSTLMLSSWMLILRAIILPIRW